MKKFLAVALSVSVVASLALAQPAIADELDPQDAGYPLRVAAYALHPVGFLLYQGICRPAHYVISSRGFRQVFGYHTDEFLQPAWETSPTQKCPAPVAKPESQPERTEKAPELPAKPSEMEQLQPAPEPSPPGIQVQPSPQEHTEPTPEPSLPGIQVQPSPQEHTEPAPQRDPRTSSVRTNFQPRRLFALK
jgi:hypothetical protein